jgi:hypothetical protein
MQPCASSDLHRASQGIEVHGRDDVEPLRPLLVDHVHRRPAAGAGGVIGRDHDLDPGQMGGQQWARNVVAAHALQESEHGAIAEGLPLAAREDEIALMTLQHLLGDGATYRKVTWRARRDGRPRWRPGAMPCVAENNGPERRIAPDALIASDFSNLLI